MDWWFTGPTLFENLWTLYMKAVHSVMVNREEMPKETFSKKQKKGEKLSA
jgi:hypothetical protein